MLKAAAVQIAVAVERSVETAVKPGCRVFIGRVGFVRVLVRCYLRPISP